MSWAFTLSIIFLTITTSILIIIALYHLFWKPKPSSTCETSNNCGINQICESGYCIEQLCSSDSDCRDGICINSYCTAFNCLNGNNCPTGTACVYGSCIKTGTSCQSNNDCFELSCMNQVCVQCLSNQNCPIGQGCFDQSCRFPYDGETGPNMITYISSAQNNGNITAPPAYFCSTSICGTGSNDPITCGETGLCPSSCPFCINSVCRCTPGQNLESCRSNGDCISGICSNDICIPSGGECFANYNGTSEGCPISKPYCSNGICSTSSLGAICGSTGMPSDLCNNPQSLGVIGVTGISPDNMGMFCRNGRCQLNPAQLNDQCTHGSCQFIEDNVLVCLPVETPSILEHRCLVAK